MMDKDAPLAVTRQCKLLAISRSSVYYQSVPVCQDLQIMRLIDELHLKRPFLGSRRMVDELEAHDLKVNRKRVQRLMRLMGIGAIYPKPKTSTPAVDTRSTHICWESSISPERIRPGQQI